MIIQNVVVWIITGLFAGWVARLAMRSRRDYGVVGDLATGWLGAVLGGWLFRQFDVWTPSNMVGDILVALTGAAMLLIGLRILRHFFTAVGITTPSAIAAGASNIDALLRHATEFDQNFIRKFLRGGHASRDVNQAFEAQLTVGERIADKVAAFGGSWPFIGMFFAALIVWMAVNGGMSKPFDPYPYILLNLILSCLAAIQAPIIMMSQNRQADRDRIDARNDFEVNLRAEMEIMALHDKLDNFRNEEIKDVMRSLEEQIQRLSMIESKLKSDLSKRSSET